MRYIIINRKQADALDIDMRVHRCKGEQVIISEKEVIISPHTTGTFDECVTHLEGQVLTNAEASCLINEGGWNYE